MGSRRRDEVTRLDTASLAALIEGVPALASAVEGRGPLTSGWPWTDELFQDEVDRPRLGSMLDSSFGVEAAILGLDRPAVQLAQLALWHGDTIERGATLDEVGHEHAAILDAAAARLRTLLISEPDRGWVALRPDSAGEISLPGVPLRWELEALNSDDVARRLRTLGGAPVPARKADRIAAVEARVRDVGVVRDVLLTLSEDARRIFAVLVEHGPQDVTELGIPYYNAYSQYYRTHYRGGRGLDRQAPLDELVDASLVAVEPEDQYACIWLDVLIGLTGGKLFPDWPTEPSTTPRPLRGAGVGLPAVLHTLSALLDHVRAVPVPALTNGGLGVRPVRAAAKALGIEAEEAGLLAHLAIGLRLLGTVEDGTTGRGRQKRAVLRYAPTPRAASFAELDGAQQWAQLVHGWRTDAWLDEINGLPERREAEYAASPFVGGVLARDPLLRLLAELPPGQGLELNELLELAAWRYALLLTPERTRGLVEALRVLELVPRTGPVGLTDLGRAVLTGPESLAAALPRPSEHFVLQADRTAVAGPELDARVARHLARYAELESDAGARIWRLDATLVARAMDEGETADDVLGFLRAHSSTGVPQNVEYLVGDVGRRHGALRLGTAASYLRSDDPALLAAAVGTKAAKLRLLAPTVAVSSLETRRLVTVLRTAGVSVLEEDERGLAVIAATAEPADEDHGWDADLSLPDPSVLAARLLSGRRTESGTTRIRPAPPPIPDGLSDDPLERLRQRQARLEQLFADDDFEDEAG